MTVTTWKHDETRLRQRYMLQSVAALALIAITIVCGAIQLQNVLSVNKQQAEIINVAGAQRMLSQRLALLPQRIEAETNAFRRARAANDLRIAVVRMREGFTFLTQAQDGATAPYQTTPDLVHLYAPEGRSLYTMTDSFLGTYEAYIAGEEVSREEIEHKRVNAETGLLVRLDRAVSLYAQAAEAQIAQAIRVHGSWVIVALGLLLLEILFVFRPMARDAARSVARIRSRLDERGELLSRSMTIAKMGHWRATNAQADPLWLSQELLDMYDMDQKEGWHPLSLIQDGDIITQDTPIEANTQHLAFKQTWDTGEPTVARSQFRKPNGQIIDMLVHLDAERDEEGRVIGVIGVIKDDTNEAQADRALRNSYDVIERKSQALMEAQRLGRMATWSRRLDGRYLDWDERAFDLLGCDPSNFDPTLENVRNLFPADDRKRLVEMTERAIQTGERQGEHFRIRRGDGAMIDLYLRSTLERDKNGEPFALFGTMQDVSKEKAAERKLEKLAYYDGLTGLANRTLFTHELEQACARNLANGEEAALLLLDLDHFKEVNDTLGHLAGDELLAIVGERLVDVVTQENFVARLGGDEFAVVLTGDITTERLDTAAQLLIESIEHSAHLHAGDVETCASIGIALIGKDSNNPETLMRYADLALYASKEKGRGCATYFEPALSQGLTARLNMETEIRAALAQSRFETHYQPLVHLETGRVSAFEALLRLPKADGGFVSPGEFIPVAESSHLIADLGAYVLNQACHEAQSWIDAGLPARRIAVNVSAAQVWHGDLEQVVDTALTRSGLQPSQLCIELTESVFAAESLGRLEQILITLKERGVVLALDDFGTGYSSLGYLNRLPFDKLKIDRTFVSGVDASAEKQKMLRGVVSLGKGLDMTVVAEGVETEEELAFVRQLGCDKVQGWYFGKAVPATQAIVEASRIEAMAVLGDIREKLRAGTKHQTPTAAANTPTVGALSLAKPARKAG